MITPELLEQVENYLERQCFNQQWLDYREQLGKPVNLRKIECLAKVAGQLNDDKFLAAHVKDLQESYFSYARLGKEPLPITDAERAKMLETHRNYFANYLFDLMRQKNFTEAEVAAKAHVDAAIFDRLRNYRKYIPQERTIWTLVLALELTFDEANNLLHRLNYCLSPRNWTESIIGFFIDKRIYDLPTVNEVLTHYGLENLNVTEDFSAPLDEKFFHDESLIERIDLYIEKNFRDLSWMEFEAKRGVKYSYSVPHLGEPAESVKTFEVIVRKLKDKIGMSGNFFSDYLFKLIKQKNLSEVEVYKAAHLDRRVFSKIRNEKNYMPAKKTVVAIAFALKLDFKEANTLLARAGYFLSSARKEDVIAAYFIDNRIYDLFLLNEVLDYYDCPLIGD